MSINIDLFWPLMEKFGRADQSLTAGLEQAKLRLDFSIAMAAIWAIYTAFWVPALLLGRASWFAFLAVALAGPFLFRLWYRMSVISAAGLFRLRTLTLKGPSRGICYEGSQTRKS